MILRDFHKKNTFPGVPGGPVGSDLGLISGRSSSLNSAVVNEKPADAPVGSLNKTTGEVAWNIDVDHFRFLSLEYQKRKGNEEEPVNLFVYRALFEELYVEFKQVDVLL